VDSSGSDWETDISESYAEPAETSARTRSAEDNIVSDAAVLVIESEAPSFSYSSILKRPSQAAASAKPASSATLASSAKQQQQSATISASSQKEGKKSARGAGVEEKKKVTTKTLIEFDLLTAVALPRKKNKIKKVEQGRTALPQRPPTVVAVRNALDSSAPQRKRGKEREGGKKKRRTVLKKAILAERARKRELREAAEHRKEFAIIFFLLGFLLLSNSAEKLVEIPGAFVFYLSANLDPVHTHQIRGGVTTF
jgi:hypothetical protein